MDIIVEGKSKLYFAPDQIEITFNFGVDGKTYENALELGSKAVVDYVAQLQKIGFDKKDIKTEGIRVITKSVYDKKTENYKDTGYTFYQQATLKFDYDTKKLASIVEATSKMKNAPKYSAKFALKQNDDAEDKLLNLAYANAEAQAKSIAKASGKTLKDCVKVSFQPFEERLTSSTRYESGMYCDTVYEKSSSARENIENVLVPEDIKVDKHIYTLWIAE